MLIIKLTPDGFVANQEISLRLFEQTGNTLIRVVCQTPWYDHVYALEDSVCNYMNSHMPAGYDVKTNHVTLNQTSGKDPRGSFIKEIDFQVYI